MHPLSKELLMRMQSHDLLLNLMAMNAGIKLPVSKQADMSLSVVRPSIEVAREVATALRRERRRKTSTFLTKELNT